MVVNHVTITSAAGVVCSDFFGKVSSLLCFLEVCLVGNFFVVYFSQIWMITVLLFDESFCLKHIASMGTAPMAVVSVSKLFLVYFYEIWPFCIFYFMCYVIGSCLRTSWRRFWTQT